MTLSAIAQSDSFAAGLGDSQHTIGLAQGAATFERALSGARKAEGTDDRVREVAEQLVGQALFLPLLKQARENPFKSDLFHGGRGEEAFGSQMDQTLADRLAQRDSIGLVDAIARRFGGAV